MAEQAGGARLVAGRRRGHRARPGAEVEVGGLRLRVVRGMGTASSRTWEVESERSRPRGRGRAGARQPTAGRAEPEPVVAEVEPEPSQSPRSRPSPSPSAEVEAEPESGSPTAPHRADQRDDPPLPDAAGAPEATRPSAPCRRRTTRPSSRRAAPSSTSSGSAIRARTRWARAPNVLPYARVAPRSARRSSAPAAAGRRFWEASAREVARAAANVGRPELRPVRAVALGNARFCRRCGTAPVA